MCISGYEARLQIGIWQRVLASGRLDALPPAFTRGVSPVRTLVTGGARQPYIFHKMAQRTRTATQKDTFVLRSAAGNSYSPRHQFENWWHPPSQVRGARPRTASTRAPFTKQPDKFQFVVQLINADKHILKFTLLFRCFCANLTSVHRIGGPFL